MADQTKPNGHDATTHQSYLARGLTILVVLTFVVFLVFSPTLAIKGSLIVGLVLAILIVGVVVGFQLAIYHAFYRPDAWRQLLIRQGVLLIIKELRATTDTAKKASLKELLAQTALHGTAADRQLAMRYFPDLYKKPQSPKHEAK